MWCGQTSAHIILLANNQERAVFWVPFDVPSSRCRCRCCYPSLMFLLHLLFCFTAACWYLYLLLFLSWCMQKWSRTYLFVSSSILWTESFRISAGYSSRHKVAFHLVSTTGIRRCLSFSNLPCTVIDSWILTCRIAYLSSKHLGDLHLLDVFLEVHSSKSPSEQGLSLV